MPRDYHKEMFDCMMTSFKRRGNSVTVTANGVAFRCKPSVDGGVILYKGAGHAQHFHFDTQVEWIAWAQEVEG